MRPGSAREGEKVGFVAGQNSRAPRQAAGAIPRVAIIALCLICLTTVVCSFQFMKIMMIMKIMISPGPQERNTRSRIIPTALDIPT